MKFSWKSLLYLLCAVQVGTGITIIGIVSFIPLYLSELGLHDQGEAAMWAGIISGVTPLMVAVSAPYWSLQANKRGPKKVLMAILATLSIAVFLSGLVETPTQLFILRILQGLVGGFVPIGLAVITQFTPEEKLPSAMGMFQAALVMGLVFGPLLGGLSADIMGYRMPFFLFSAVSALCFLAIACLMPNVEFEYKVSNNESQFSLMKYFLSIPQVRILVGLLFLSNFGITGIGPILPLYIKHYMTVPSEYVATIVGIIIFGAGLLSALASLSIARITKLVGMERILVVMTFAVAVFFVLQYYMPHVWGLGIARSLTGFFIGFITPIANTLVSRSVPAERRGIVFGTLSSLVMMGNVLGPVSSGIIANWFGYGAVFWTTAAIFLVAAISVWRTLLSNQHR